MPEQVSALTDHDELDHSDEIHGEPSVVCAGAELPLVLQQVDVSFSCVAEIFKAVVSRV